MRSTFYTVPCSKDLLNQCRIPLGLVIQPMADVPLSEVGVPSFLHISVCTVAFCFCYLSQTSLLTTFMHVIDTVHALYMYMYM